MGYNIDYLFVWLLILSGLLWIVLKLILKEMQVGGETKTEDIELQKY